MLKVRITTQEKNDSMFSTDEEDESHTGEHAYNVDIIDKKHKPIFILFLDVVFAITFCSMSTLYYWTQIPIEKQTEGWSFNIDFI